MRFFTPVLFVKKYLKQGTYEFPFCKGATVSIVYFCNMKGKEADGILYRWLGWIGGSLIMINMFLAALLVWNEELSDWYYHQELFVKEVKAKPLPYAQLLKAAQAAAPGKKLYGSEIKPDKNRCYEFTTYLSCDTCSGAAPWSATVYWDKIYVDPYTAQVTGVVDMRYNWIEMSRRIHQNLLIRH